MIFQKYIGTPDSYFTYYVSAPCMLKVLAQICCLHRISGLVSTYDQQQKQEVKVKFALEQAIKAQVGSRWGGSLTSRHASAT